jgi:hypothetical protein
MKQKTLLLLFRALAACLLAQTAIATPITYTAFTDTDGQLGTWSFHNARVYLTFHSDTSTVQTIDVPNIFISNSMTEAVFNPTGTASVTIITAGKTVHANFAPNQLFVSLDHGTLPGPFQGGRGVGFGMFSATAPGGIEPTYPLGIEDGTIDWGDAATPSAATQALSNDLQHNTAFSGRVLSCINFPADFSCSAPAPALHTDKGDFYLNAPYINLVQLDELNGGFFIAHLQEEESGGSDDSSMYATAQWTAQSSTSGQKPITYTGALISNAKLGGHFYQNAQIYISFAADRSTALPFTDAQSAGYINATGSGRLRIVHGSSVVSATFAPNQLYVYYDKTHGSIGIGSQAGGRGYPFSVTRNEDVQGLVENSTIGAITDILSGALPAGDFTSQTATLKTDLTNATVLSGAVSSCVSFNPVTSICSALTPVALHTSAGDFYLYEPFTDDETSPYDGTHPFSINWGVFWSEIPASHDD